MIPLFDIFRAEPNGDLRWLEAAPDLDKAKQRIRTLAVSSPGEYLVLNQRTGNKTTIRVEDSGASPC